MSLLIRILIAAIAAVLIIVLVPAWFDWIIALVVALLIVFAPLDRRGSI
jgi:hypothetical protein